MTATRKFLRLPAIMEATEWSRATIRKKENVIMLPAPTSTGRKSIACEAAEIAQWQHSCIAASRGVDE